MIASVRLAGPLVATLPTAPLRPSTDINVFEDREAAGHWRVEYFKDNGGCYAFRSLHEKLSLECFAEALFSRGAAGSGADWRANVSRVRSYPCCAAKWNASRRNCPPHNKHLMVLPAKYRSTSWRVRKGLRIRCISPATRNNSPPGR